MKTVIHNATIFANTSTSPILTRHAIVLEGNRIMEVGPEDDLKTRHREAAQLDAGGRLLMPGLINVHTHFYSTFARGLALPTAPKNFAEILSKLWWKLDASLEAEAVYYSALLAALTAIKSGVTAVIDHHASPNTVEGSLDRIEEALAHVGLRGVLCYEISDRDGKAIAKQGLRENERYLKKCRLANQLDSCHLFDALIGLHASFTLESETLAQAAALSQTLQTGCHIHVLEDDVDRRLTQEKYRCGVVARLQQFGILGPQTIAAHCIHLSEAEKDAITLSLALVAHNPQSNMNNAVGRADVFGLMQRGVVVGLGTDGMSGDLKPDLRAASLLHKHDLRDCNAGWNEVQQMVLTNNREIYRRVSGKQVGVIAPGYLADLILVDYYPATPLTADNFWGHFLFGIADAPVDTTIINGKLVLRNKELLHVNEQRLAHEARAVAAKVWQRFYA